MVHSKQLGPNKQNQQSNTNAVWNKQMTAVKTQNLDRFKIYILHNNGSVTAKQMQ